MGRLTVHVARKKGAKPASVPASLFRNLCCYTKAYSRYLTPLNVPKPALDSPELFDRIVALQHCTLPGNEFGTVRYTNGPPDFFYPGFCNALARSVIEGPIYEFEKPYPALGKTDLEVLVIWVSL